MKSVFFFWEKITNFDLELQGVAENHSTVAQRLSIMFLRIWSMNFLFVKSLMGLPFKWNFFLRKNKLRCGSELRKISKSKIASVRLKTFLFDFYQTSEFSWVKTRMGLQRTKVPYFFLSADKFVFVRFLRNSDEWMKKLFFFPVPEKKNSSEIEWMNGMWTFPRTKKKKTENHPKISKNRLFFFFPALSEKKKTRFSDLNEWMTNELIPGKKKYGTFGLPIIY